jgi:1,3-beta-glucan synthase
MSGHPQGGHYDDGYGHPHQPTDSYYHDDQAYYDQHQDYPQNQHVGEGYYDES